MNRLPQRVIYFILLLIIIPLGLYSKNITGTIIEIIDVKDIIWAIMIYYLTRLLFIDWSIKRVAVTALIFSILIEFSQLYHDDWIDKLRSTFIGELILGSAFVWTDLIAYSIGIGFGIFTDYLVKYYH